MSKARGWGSPLKHLLRPSKKAIPYFPSARFAISLPVSARDSDSLCRKKSLTVDSSLIQSIMRDGFSLVGWLKCGIQAEVCHVQCHPFLWPTKPCPFLQMRQTGACLWFNLLSRQHPLLKILLLHQSEEEHAL